MISKLSKIFASAAIFGALVFSTTAAQADGMDPCHKPKHKPCHTPVHNEPCYTPPPPCPEPCPEPIKTGLMGGMTIGISGDWGFAINENNDTIFAGIRPTLAVAPAFGTPGFTATPFNARHDYAYGGNISWGYMMNNGLEANIELGYHQLKNKGAISANFVKSDIISGLINGTYYADFGSMVLPYVSIGVGIARTKANGVIGDYNSALSTLSGYTAVATGATPPFVATAAGNGDILTFNDLKATRLAYQAGLGISAMFDSALVGIGYKFFGVNDINSNDSDFTDFSGTITGFTGNAADAATVSSGTIAAISSGTTTTNLGSILGNVTSPNFGSITNQIHNVSIFAKFVV